MGVLAVTGHRTERLGLSYSEADRLLLTEFAGRILFGHMADNRIDRIYAGAAQGWDMAIMDAALALGIPVVACVPFEGQEKKWPSETQDRYRELLRACKSLGGDVVVVSEGGYAGWKFIERDRFMVDRADEVIALYDQVKLGGTAATCAYAEKKKVPIQNCWDEWVTFKEKRS